MNGFIRLKNTDTETEQDYEEDIELVVRQFAFPLQENVRKAFRLAEEQDYERAAELCCRILDEDAEKPEIRYLLGICYFSQSKLEAAAIVLADLVEEYPEEDEYRCLLGITYHAMGVYGEAEKLLRSVYSPEEYRPFYFTSYGDSLQAVGKIQESRDIFYQEVEHYKKTGKILSKEMLDGAFQNLLYLDVKLGNRKYQEDLAIYFHFLDEVEMTEKMQDYLGSTVVYLSTLMQNKWYLPLFLELITYIERKGFFTTDEAKMRLASAYLAWESYAFHDDGRISKVTETFLNRVYDTKYTILDADSEEMKNDILADMLICRYHMCRYVPSHMEELEYVREVYPHSYECCREELETISADPETAAEETLAHLQRIEKGWTLEERREMLQEEYEKLTSEERHGEYVSDGDVPYRRSQVKIGRNDPCPCGSGKKYKKCCGR